MTTQRDKDSGYYRLYEQKRKHDGRKEKRRRKRLRTIVRCTASELGKDAGFVWRAIRVAMLKTQTRMSFRQLATYFEQHSAERSRCGLSYSPSKSTLHGMMVALAELGKDLMDRIISAMGDHSGDLHGDSTGFALGRHKIWRHAKFGNISKRDFVKLHFIAGVRDMIAAFEVTSGTAGDSPQFKKMLKHIRSGFGIVTLDAAYDSYENCEKIVENGRIPVIDSAKGRDKPRGMNARAKMLQWKQDRPKEFDAAYKKRNPVEAKISSIKERTGPVLRSRRIGTITVELFARVLCYNLTV